MSFAISRRVWDMEHSFVGCLESPTTFAPTTLLLRREIYTLCPEQYTPLLLLQCNAKKQGGMRRKLKKPPCVIEHRGKELPGTCCRQHVIEHDETLLPPSSTIATA